MGKNKMVFFLIPEIEVKGSKKEPPLFFRKKQYFCQNFLAKYVYCTATPVVIDTKELQSQKANASYHKVLLRKTSKLKSYAPKQKRLIFKLATA